MADDLISRQAAIKAIEDLQDCYNGFSDTYDKACIIGVLEEIPTAQVNTPTDTPTDTISRQAAIDRINKQREHLEPDVYPQDKIGDAAYRICAEFIERLPSAQRTGRWIVVDEQEPRRYGCSECKRLVWHIENYCPNCGARMEVQQ